MVIIMDNEKIAIDEAVAKFRELMEGQLERAKRIKAEKDFIDYQNLDKIVIGICGGDGIGPVITKESERVLRFLLKDEVESGKVEFKEIDGLTIENRAKCLKAIPDDVLEELKACHVILKGPTTTPRQGDGWPNVESANVAMRKELDLFANMRPVRVPEEGIDWTFFRENTEGGYAVGSYGVNITDDLAVDFTVATQEGCERISRLAYEYAKKNNKGKVSIITKANIIKTTDGKFLNTAKKIGKEYPDIVTDDWYIDITTAKLIDPMRRKDFKVFVLPNLYGDIITDEAAEFQGGVGTAGSANIGKKYAMFEAIHGSAPRMISEGRGQYADPCSMLRATVMMLSHIGFQDKADALEKALDKCMFTEKKLTITGRDTGCTCDEFGDYVMETITKDAE
jgi:isocitrate dehydrogenase (NAD+)